MDNVPSKKGIVVVNASVSALKQENREVVSEKYQREVYMQHKSLNKEIVQKIHNTLKKFAGLLLVLSIFPAVSYASDAGKVVLVSGDVHVSGSAVQLNSMIQEGAIIKTGSDGYLYIKTIDNGFLILRPNSQVRIANYSVDTVNPEKTQIKFELLSGVARSISGDAVKKARQNFRFNTPVAAIGVRGTDFTVFTDQETTRVSVYSGGIVASGFGQDCLTTGNGPCEGANSLDLFARQQGQVMQINRDQMMPKLINSSALSPDAVAPPRSDEPAAKMVQANANATNINRVPVDLTLTKVNAAIQTSVPANLVNDTIIWGRWKEVLGKSAEVNIQKQSDTQAQSVAINNYYVIFKSKNADGQLPSQGSFGFSMQNSQAVVFDEVSSALTPASLENGKLNIDFANASFKTSFDLVSNKERFALQSQGSLAPDGTLSGENQFARPTNMAVTGVVTEKGYIASYLFQSRLSTTRIASGVTYWTK